MLKFYISYFYKVRKMSSNLLPMSTAVWDPKWFHDNKGPEHRFIDKNGVINGVRMNGLMMPMYAYEQLIKEGNECRPYCPLEGNSSCPFMEKYAECVRKRYSDFEKFVAFCEGYADFVSRVMGNRIDAIVFLVHEAPWKKCGERPVLQEWFAENGYELKEWEEQQ